MATDYNDIIARIGGGAGATEPSKRYGGVDNSRDTGFDFGRGPGTPGGGVGIQRSTAPSPIGEGGGGYTEADLEKILRGMPPEKVAAIQRQMQRVGLLPENYRSFGFVESSTRAGFAELLTVSNMRDRDYQSTLESIVEGGPGALAEERKAKARLNFQTRLNTFERSDPAGVRQTAEQAFQQALGRKPTASESARFVNGFMQREQASQAGVFAANDRLDAESLGRQQEAIDADFAAQGGGGAPMGGVDALMAAIGGQESGNNYNAKNGRTGASGKYQIMPANWPAWSKEAGLGANAARSPENQERVARFKLEQYNAEFGTAGAAVAWYAGPGAAKAYAKNPDASRFTRKQGKGNEPSIQEYVEQVTSRMGSAPQAGAPAGNGSEADELQSRLRRMLADAPGNIKLGAATRSYAEQVAAKEREKRGGPKAATPGKSKHGDGRANDLQYGGDEKARQWVIANAGKYGLALPIYNPNLPRRLDESWHVELAPGVHEGLSSGGGAVAPNGQAISENITVQRQDMGAQAIEYARNVNPTETAAYDIGGQFNSLVSILQKGVI